MKKALITAVLVIAIIAILTLALILEADRRELSVGGSQPQPAGSTPIRIGLVDNSDRQYNDGCGCSFWPVNKRPKFDDPETWKYLLVGNYDKQAWMNINGRIIQLRLTESTIKYKGRKGDRFQQVYQAGDITVNVECIATGFGDTHAVDCDATITVVNGAQKQVVKATGDCGC
jgi:hypothetical protein